MFSSIECAAFHFTAAAYDAHSRVLLSVLSRQVMLLDLPSTRPEKEWVLRGVAAVMECGAE